VRDAKLGDAQLAVDRGSFVASSARTAPLQIAAL